MSWFTGLIGRATAAGISTTLDSASNFGTTMREVFTGEPSPEKWLRAKEVFSALMKKLNEAQTAVNAIEAQSASLFIAGWRPFVGWICGLGLAYGGLIQPVGSWLSLLAGIPSPPVVDTGAMVTVLIGMLGMGGLRTYEKKAGIQGNH